LASFTPKVKNNRFQAMIKFLSRTGQKFNHRLKAVVFNFWRNMYSKGILHIETDSDE